MSTPTPWPHWFLCIQGEGYFLIDKERVPLEFGTWVHVPGGVRHNFGNTGKGAADGPVHRAAGGM